MKVKAKDQVHISSVRAETIRQGEVFDVSEPVGKELIRRGLVSQVRTKKAAEPKNKAAPTAENKSG